MHYAVMGNPIHHSLSPLIQAHFAKVTGRDITYGRVLVEGPFAAAADAFFKTGGAGCNITLPCKLEAWEYAQRLSDNAKAAGAVNTLKKEQDGSISGFNTDGPGLMLDLKRLNFPLKGARVLVLGAGGAVKGIMLPLLTEGAAAVTVVNRTVKKAEDIAAAHPDKVTALSFAALKESTERFDLIINGTALSLKGELPDLDDKLIAGAQAVYDLMYTPEGRTIFTDHCKALGVKQCSDGLGMLVSQAALSFEIWQGVRPDVGEALTYVGKALAERQAQDK